MNTVHWSKRAQDNKIIQIAKDADFSVGSLLGQFYGHRVSSRQIYGSNLKEFRSALFGLPYKCEKRNQFGLRTTSERISKRLGDARK